MLAGAALPVLTAGAHCRCCWLVLLAGAASGLQCALLTSRQRYRARSHRAAGQQGLTCPVPAQLHRTRPARCQPPPLLTWHRGRCAGDVEHGYHALLHVLVHVAVQQPHARIVHHRVQRGQRGGLQQVLVHALALGGGEHDAVPVHGVDVLRAQRGHVPAHPAGGAGG